MHLDNFQIKARAQNLRGFARQPEEGVDAGGVIGGPNDGNAMVSQIGDLFSRWRMASRADDQRLAVPGAERGDFRGRGVRTEIDRPRRPLQ